MPPRSSVALGAVVAALVAMAAVGAGETAAAPGRLDTLPVPPTLPLPLPGLPLPLPAPTAQPLPPAAPLGKFGIFIHYGPSTLVNTSDGDAWVHAVWSTSYPALVGTFHPNAAAAASWVAFAKRAGASYLVFTAKHHDGYALWPTHVRFDRSAGASAYQWQVPPDQDVLGAVAQAARAANLPLYVYYSLPDWYEHSYRVSDPVRYLPLVEAQLQELLTGYGPFAGIWLDGAFDRPMSFWHLDELEQEIHQLQPQAEIGVNRHPSSVDPGEGFQIYEESLPETRSSVPTQVTYPLGAWWFYSTADKPMSHAKLAALQKRVNCVGASLLLDVPPRVDGTIDPLYAAAVLGPAPRRTPKRGIVHRRR